MHDWFRVDEGLYGGCYPQAFPPGVDFVVDLTEEGELPPYELGALEHRRLPIRDFGVPSEEQMRRILDTVDDALREGRTVLVHCRGGIGRTGTVVGCWLREHGATAEEAFAALDGRPETEEQRALIGRWGPDAA